MSAKTLYKQISNQFNLGSRTSALWQYHQRRQYITSKYRNDRRIAF